MMRQEQPIELLTQRKWEEMHGKQGWKFAWGFKNFIPELEESWFVFNRRAGQDAQISAQSFVPRAQCSCSG